MVWQADFGRISQMIRELYGFGATREASIDRLAHIALDIVALRTAYEGILESDAPRSQKQQARRAIEQLEELSKIIAKMYMVRRARGTWQPGLAMPMVVTP